MCVGPAGAGGMEGCKRLPAPLPAVTVCWSTPWSPKFFGTISIAIVLFCFLNISCPRYRDLGAQCTAKGWLCVRRLPRVAAWHLAKELFWFSLKCSVLLPVLFWSIAGLACRAAWGCYRLEEVPCSRSPARQQREAAPGLFPVSMD